MLDAYLVRTLREYLAGLRVGEFQAERTFLCLVEYVAHVDGAHGVAAALLRCERHAETVGTVGYGDTHRAFVHSAGVAAVIHAHGKHVLLAPAYGSALGIDGVFALHVPRRGVAAFVGVQTAGLAYEHAVEVGLVHIVDAAEVELHGGFHVRRVEQRLRHDELQTVPGECLVVVYALHVPCLAHDERLPCTVVECRRLPFGVVAHMELRPVKIQILCTCVPRKRRRQQG